LDIITARIVFAKSRRAATNWFRWAGVSQRYKAFYYLIGSIGRKTEIIAIVLFEFMVNLLTISLSKSGHFFFKDAYFERFI